MRKSLLFWIGLIIFVLLLALSILYESTAYLYIASVLPVLFVPFLPDFGSNQYINPGKNPDQVEIIRFSGKSAASPLLMIRFRPGYLHWSKKWLYFSVSDISPYPTLPIPDDKTASLSALRHDLKPHPRRRGWIGVRIDHMKLRTQHLSYTLKEINRIVVRMEDVQELLKPDVASNVRSKNLQA